MIGRKVYSEFLGTRNVEGTISHYDEASHTAIVDFPSGDSATMTIKKVGSDWCRDLNGSYRVRRYHEDHR